MIRLIITALVSCGLIPLLFDLFGQIPSEDADATECIIAYSNYDYKLYTMDCDGRNKQKVWDITLVTLAWSPDGRMIAYDNGVNIYVLEFATGDITKLTATEDGPFYAHSYPTWSPDGERLAFISRDGAISVMDIDGSNVRIFEVNPMLTGLAWSPDGRYVAFIEDIGAEYNDEMEKYDSQFITLIEVDNPDAESNTIKLTRNVVDECSAGEYYYNPTWYWPTNQITVAITCGGDYMDIYLIDVPDDIEQDRITYTSLTQDEFNFQAGYRGMSWAPNGDRLALVAFVDDDTRSSEIFVLDVRESLLSGSPIVTQLTQAPEGGLFRGLSWRP